MKLSHSFLSKYTYPTDLSCPSVFTKIKYQAFLYKYILVLALYRFITLMHIILGVLYPSNTALTFQSHSYSLQKMYKNTFQTLKLPTLKLPKCQKGPTTSHLLTASGRFKHPWRHYKKILILKLFKKLD